jgi:hypothetical protein
MAQTIAYLTGKRLRVEFRADERDAWYIARQLKRLSPVRRYQIRVLIECMQERDALANLAADMAAHDDEDRPGA